MIRSLSLALALLLPAAKAVAQTAAAAPDFADLASPLVGTDSEYKFSNGNVYPAVAAPFGMTFWTPRTGKPSGWIYQYSADRIRGFQATHQPSPWMGDYGHFCVMPFVGDAPGDEPPSSAFSHATEISKPHYYAVTLEDSGVRVEMTATERCAVMRFKFPPGKRAWLFFDVYRKGEFTDYPINAPGGINLRMVFGTARDQRGGVAGDFGCRFVADVDARVDGMETSADGRRRAIEIKPQKDGLVTLRIGTSFISQKGVAGEHKQAFMNLEREVGDKPFDDLVAANKAVWNKRLGQIEIEGATDDQRVTFYSNMYRAHLFPRIFHEFDADGQVVHYSPYSGKVEPGEMYADNGFWDTFRAIHPLITILDPELEASMIRGWINAYKEGGWFPKWASPGYRDCMIGTHVESVVADALAKGITDFDLQLAADASLKDATARSDFGGYGRKGIDHYLKEGYVASDKTGEATARTLEFAYDDWSAAQVLRHAGRLSDAEPLLERAQNYRNVFDPAVGMMRGRLADGSWRPDFKADEWGGPFTEGSSWHYTWSVIHDMPGLIELMGGDKPFVAKLDEMLAAEPTFGVGHYGFEIHEMTEMVACNMGQYAHGNQPVHHVLYLYNFGGAPWKTAAPVRQVVDTLYGPGVDGYCGDEDNGQMAAWYLFSVLGFYPVCPGKPGYVLGSPRFAKATIHLPSGEDFVVDAPGNSDSAIHIGSAAINGRPLERSWIKHEEIARGGVLRTQMSPTPNKSWAVDRADRPFGDWPVQ